MSVFTLTVCLGCHIEEIRVGGGKKRSLSGSSERSPLAWLQILRRMDHRLIPRSPFGDVGLACRILTKRLFPLYAVVLVTIWSCALLVARYAPAEVTFALPMLFSLAILYRILHWLEINRRTTDAIDLRREIENLRFLAPLFAAATTTWLCVLDRYATPQSDTMIHVVTSLSSMATIFCLGATPFTAGLVAAGILLTKSIVALALGSGHGAGLIAVEVAMLTSAIWLGFSYQADLLKLVIARRRVVRNERKTSRQASRERRHAALDPLTGLLNRRAFLSIARDAVEAMSERPFRLAIVDLDGFKAVNDTMGHAAGDKLLNLLAGRLEQSLRDAFVGRLGGDEFAILIVGEAADTEVEQMLGSIVERICEPIHFENMILNVGASLGHYDSRAGFAQNLEAILERADAAMYAAKQVPGPAVIAFDAEMERAWQMRRLLMFNVSQPDFERHMSLVYQSIWDTQHNRAHAVEALVRWQSPASGPMSASDFIEIANSSGRMTEVTAAIFRRALAECKAWNWGCDLHLNITGRDLLTSGAMGRLATIIAQAGAPREKIVFEISERSIGDLERAIPLMEAMRERGFRFALDDVCSGTSSFIRLCSLPVDIIKTDARFKGNAGEDSRYEALVLALIEFAQRARMDCVVEGVETTDDVLRVARLGGRLMQGYFFDHPVNADLANALLSAPHSARNSISRVSQTLAVASQSVPFLTQSMPTQNLVGRRS